MGEQDHVEHWINLDSYLLAYDNCSRLPLLHYGFYRDSVHQTHRSEGARDVATTINSPSQARPMNYRIVYAHPQILVLSSILPC